MPENAQAPAISGRRRRLRIYSRVLLSALAVVGMWAAWKSYEASRVRRARAEVARLGGYAYFDFEEESRNPYSSGQPEHRAGWYERLLGPEYFHFSDCKVAAEAVARLAAQRPTIGIERFDGPLPNGP